MRFGLKFPWLKSLLKGYNTCEIVLPVKDKTEKNVEEYGGGRNKLREYIRMHYNSYNFKVAQRQGSYTGPTQHVKRLDHPERWVGSVKRNDYLKYYVKTNVWISGLE